jgi:hypothetical protein
MVENIKAVVFFNLQFVPPHSLYVPVFAALLWIQISLKYLLKNIIVIKETEERYFEQ